MNKFIIPPFIILSDASIHCAIFPRFDIYYCENSIYLLLKVEKSLCSI